MGAAPPAIGVTARAPAAGALRRRRALPNGRAVLGALLITVSAVGMFAAWTGATAPPTGRYVVAARDLAPGSRLTADDLRLATMDLPDALARNGAFGTVAALVGATVVGPINAGELVQAGAVATGGGAPAEHLELSFAIEASKALSGTLEPGELVDVLATFGAGGDTYTTTVAAGARVVRVDRDAGRGATELQTIAVALRTADAARAVTHALNAGEVVLVRTTAAGGADRAGTYRAPAAREDGAP